MGKAIIWQSAAITAMGLIVFIAGCAVPSAPVLPGPPATSVSVVAIFASPTPTPDNLPSPTPTATNVAGSLPDLVTGWMSITTEKGGCILSLPVALGVSLSIANAGTADAGPFVIEVNGVRQTVTQGLPRGKSITLWFSGAYSYGGETVATVDVLFQVQESNEENNSLSRFLPLPTPPPTCTPTPTPTPPTPTSSTGALYREG